jgi:hypothetical protein
MTRNSAPPLRAGICAKRQVRAAQQGWEALSLGTRHCWHRCGRRQMSVSSMMCQWRLSGRRLRPRCKARGRPAVSVPLPDRAGSIVRHNVVDHVVQRVSPRTLSPVRVGLGARGECRRRSWRRCTRRCCWRASRRTATLPTGSATACSATSRRHTPVSAMQRRRPRRPRRPRRRHVVDDDP